MTARVTNTCLLHEAMHLASLGFAVHWLRGPEGGSPDGRGKSPIFKRWQHQPWLSPRQLRDSYRPGFNVGIHTGLVGDCAAPVVVVDCDDAEALRWCQRQLPWTPIAARTRNGVHLFYWRPAATLHVASRGKVGGMALDVRADGGNVVVAPSVHPDGGCYEWLRHPSTVNLGDVPEYRPEWLPAAPAVVPVVIPRGAMGQRSAAAYERARAYARQTPPAVAGQGGSLATFKLAVALVRGFALPEEQALAVLATEFNPRCEPPWNEAELIHKVRCAHNAGRVAVGSLLDTPSPSHRNAHRAQGTPCAVRDHEFRR